MVTLEPQFYPRRALVMVVGLTPALVTETLYALAFGTTSFVPTEIHLITTEAGKTSCFQALGGAAGKIAELAQDHSLAISPDDIRYHVLGSDQGCPLDDVRTPDDNEITANTILRVVQELCADPGSAVHVSLAGGRKTMGYYAGYALTLHGRLQDRLSHVLVNQPFETLTEFYFPPKTPREFSRSVQPPRPPDETRYNSADAMIDLAQIPFVPVGRLLQPKLLTPEHGFSAAVGRAKQVMLLLEQSCPLELDCSSNTLVVAGLRIPIEPRAFAFYRWFAEFLDEQDGVLLQRVTPDQAQVLLRYIRETDTDNDNDRYERTLEVLKVLFTEPKREELSPARTDARRKLGDYKNNLNSALRAAFGEIGEDLLGIRGVGREKELRYVLVPKKSRFQVLGVL